MHYGNDLHLKITSACVCVCVHTWAEAVPEIHLSPSPWECG